MYLMITVICGEDTATSRRYFVQLRNQYTQKGYEIKDITTQQIPDLPRWLAESVPLFGQKQVFFIERMDNAIMRKRGRKSTKPADPLSMEAIIAKLASDKTLEIVDWEEKSGREIKLKDSANLKEFKPSTTIFKLLDAFTPGNKANFVSELRVLIPEQDEIFIFIMLYRHIRSLLMASDDEYSKTVQPWQRMKLRSTARMFKKEQLAGIYQALYRLEVSSKTGTNPHGIQKSLEILACYYL